MPLIISTSNDLPLFKKLLSDGSKWGLELEYTEQPSPDGLPQAFILGEQFIGNHDVALILGDNMYYGYNFSAMLKEAMEGSGATIFAYPVRDPKRFGIVEIDEDRKAISLEEKPNNPKSNLAVTGLYFFDNEVIKIAKRLKHSSRGELEILDAVRPYMDNSDLHVKNLGRGFAWLDTGTHDSLLEASNFVYTVEKRQGFKVACLEEIAWNNGWISDEQLQARADELSKNSYGSYLSALLENDNV